MGKLYAVGFGPGGYEHMTAKAIDVIKNADVITGYTCLLYTSPSPRDTR